MVFLSIPKPTPGSTGIMSAIIARLEMIKEPYRLQMDVEH
jgi:hypothetical protein